MAESKHRQPMVSEKALGDHNWQDEKRIIHITQLINDIFDALKNRSGLISSHYDVKVAIAGQKDISLPAYFQAVTNTMIKLLEKFKTISYDVIVQKGHEALSRQDQDQFDLLIEQILEAKRVAHKLEPFSKEATSRCNLTLLECFDTLNKSLNEIKYGLREAILRSEAIKEAKQLEVNLGVLKTELVVEKESKLQAINSAEEKIRSLEESVKRLAALETINQTLRESESKARQQAAQTSATIQEQQLTINRLKAENARLSAQPPREQKSEDKLSEEKAAVQEELGKVKAQLADREQDVGKRQDKVNRFRTILQGLQLSPVTRLVVGEGLGLGTIATGVALGLGLLTNPVGWFAAGIVIGIGAAVCIWSAYEAYKDQRLASEIENLPFRVGDKDSGMLGQSVGQMMKRMPDLKNKQPETAVPSVVNAVTTERESKADISQSVGAAADSPKIERKR